MAVSTDDLGQSINAVKSLDHGFAERLRALQATLSQCSLGDTLSWPDLTRLQNSVADQLGDLFSEDARNLLDKVLWLSARTVRVAKGNGRKRTALDSRDMLPQDFQPVLVLDASGRVRSTYKNWEKTKGVWSG